MSNHAEAGSGNDEIFDFEGYNLVDADAGDDFVSTGYGDDLIHGWDGDDILR